MRMDGMEATLYPSLVGGNSQDGNPRWQSLAVPQKRGLACSLRASRTHSPRLSGRQAGLFLALTFWCLCVDPQRVKAARKATPESGTTPLRSSLYPCGDLDDRTL